MIFKFGITRLLPLLFLFLLVSVACLAEAPPLTGNSFTEVTMRITHRIYPSFVDTLTVGPKEELVIGDSEFSFEVLTFLADFGIKSDGTIVSRSNIAHNPAFEIIVYEDDQEKDRHWAFFGNGSKPHYRRDSLLAFEVISFSAASKTLTKPVPREGSPK